MDRSSGRVLTVAAVLAFAFAAPAGAQTVLFTDDFEDGNANGWTAFGGTWSVVTDGTRVYRQSSGSSRYRSGAGSTAWTNYSVEARVKPTTWNGTDRFAGLAARLRDRYNGYVLALRSSGRVEMLRIVSGTSTALASRPFPVTLGTWYTLRIDVVGTTLRGYVNGALQFTATDGTFAAGLVGGATDYATASFDNFRVTEGGTPPGNQAPQVQAGADQTIVISSAASLFGSASDDGLPAPPGAVTCTWSRTSGPGTVTFAPNVNALQATARFSAVGVYVLTLTCSDSALTASDSVGIDVRDEEDPPPPTPGPLGFASVNALGQNGTTGGLGGPTVTVSTAEEFLDFIARPGPYVIRVNGLLPLPSGMHNVTSHKSIIGVGSNSGITGAGLNIGDPVSEATTPPPGGGVRNVIIRNMIFRDSPDDAINVQMFAHHVWIDHNELSDGFDGLIDIKRGADYVTVSWNHTHHHTKNMLLGHSDGNGAQDIGRLKVTYHHNWFDDTPQRNPRVRFGEPVHIFNNYFFSNSDVGRGLPGQRRLHGGGQLLRGRGGAHEHPLRGPHRPHGAEEQRVRGRERRARRRRERGQPGGVLQLHAGQPGRREGDRDGGSRRGQASVLKQAPSRSHRRAEAPAQHQDADRRHPAAGRANGDARPRGTEGYDHGRRERHDHERGGGNPGQPAGLALRLREAHTVEPAVQQAQGRGQDRRKNGGEPAIQGQEASDQEERDGRARDGNERCRRQEAEKASHQPGAGEREEDPPSGRRSVEARQQSDRDDGDEVLQAHPHVGDAVVDRPQPRRHQMCTRRTWRQRDEQGRDGDEKDRGLPRALASCDGPPQERDPGHGHGRSRRTQREASRPQAVDQADRDADAVEQPGGDDESHAVRLSALARRQLGAVGVAVKDGEERDQQTGGGQGRAGLARRPSGPAAARRARSRLRHPAAERPSGPAVRPAPSSSGT